MIKISNQLYGGSILIASDSDTENELITWHTIMFNYGITNSELDIVHSQNGYSCIVTSTIERLIKGFEALKYVQLKNQKIEHRKIINGKRISVIMKMAKDEARKALEQITQETIIRVNEMGEAIERRETPYHISNIHDRAYTTIE